MLLFIRTTAAVIQFRLVSMKIECISGMMVKCQKNLIQLKGYFRNTHQNHTILNWQMYSLRVV